MTTPVVMTTPKDMETIKRKVREVARLVSRKVFINFHPNTLTIIGFIITCYASLLYASGVFWLGGIVLLIGGMFDIIDGEVAKLTNKSSKFGAFLDSCVDRYSDFIILFGMFCWYYNIEQTLPIILIFLAILGSYIVSYTRARAEGLGIECKVGLGERGVRIPIIIIGSLFGSKIFIGFLLVIALLTNITGVYRIWWVWRKIK